LAFIQGQEFVQEEELALKLVQNFAQEDLALKLGHEFVQEEELALKLGQEFVQEQLALKPGQELAQEEEPALKLGQEFAPEAGLSLEEGEVALALEAKIEKDILPV